ncbi:hypothetical protein WJX73_002241 [Symbiochloris irregularis]|uniref:Uncharacterized protein n=1 Tax=Symbiochloris irregularis TaxID=706552 RepID=A0AAW1PA54_9CHLO
MASLSTWEHMGIGAIAGMTEVLVNQPTVAVKNAVQEGRPIPWTQPKQLYRGVVINCTSFAPITAIQFGSNRALEGMLNSAGYESNNLTKVAAAGGAGAMSAVCGCPGELVMIQQQRTGMSLGGTFRDIVSRYGPTRIYKGLAVTAVRDSLYTAGYLGVCPVLHEYVQNMDSFKGRSPTVQFLAAGITAGLLGAIITHPADTIKTRQQAFLDSKANPEYRSMLSTYRHLVSKHGVGILMSGFGPRTVRIVSATMVLQVVRTNLVKLVEKQKGIES